MNTEKGFTSPASINHWILIAVSGGSRISRRGNYYAENCMEMKAIGRGGGRS